MSGYIADIRKLVGHRTVIQCAASIIILDDQNRVLLGKRADNHMWGYIMSDAAPYHRDCEIELHTEDIKYSLMFTQNEHQSL